MCKAFEFRHLPVAGGLYDQHPEFLDKMLYIMQAESVQREKEDKAKERKRMGGKGPPPKDYMGA